MVRSRDTTWRRLIGGQATLLRRHFSTTGLDYLRTSRGPCAHPGWWLRFRRLALTAATAPLLSAVTG